MLTQHTTAARISGLASLGAGAIHVAVVADHAATWWLSGLFFALLAAFQIPWGALALIRPRLLSQSRLGAVLVATSILVNLGSAVLWALTRWVTGEPFGPQAGTPLPIGPAGIASTVLEIALVLALLVALRLPHHPSRGLVPVLAAAVLVVAAPTAWGIDGALAHDHASHSDDGHHDGDDGHHDKEAPHEDEVSHGPGGMPSRQPGPGPADGSTSPETGGVTPAETPDAGQDSGHGDGGHGDDGHGH